MRRASGHLGNLETLNLRYDIVRRNQSESIVLTLLLANAEKCLRLSYFLHDASDVTQ